MIQLTTILVLSIIAFQDFKNRLVHWILFPVLFILFGAYNYFNGFNNFTLIDFLINIGIVLLILVYLKLFFSLKNRSWVKIIDQKIGLGDILFFISLTLLMPSINYFAFLWGSFFVTIILTLITRIIGFNNFNNIPLAGLQSIFLIPFLAVELKLNKTILNQTDWINLITK